MAARSSRSATQILYTVVGLAFLNWRVFLKRLWVPFVLLLLVESTGYFLQDSWAVWLLSLVSIPLYVVLAVKTHRLYLLGPSDPRIKGHLEWSGRETRFLVFMLAMALGSMAVIIGLMFVSPALGIISYFATLYVVARLSMVFPATAIDHSITLRESWKISKRHQLLVLIVVLGVPILFSAVTKLLDLIPYALPFNFLIGSLTAIFVIGCLSLTYQQLVNDAGS